MLILFVVRDDTSDAGWQSGLYKAAGKEKPSYTAFRFPLTQASRRGTLVGLWGEIRPRTGTQPYRIRRYENRRWSWVTGVRQTDARGAFTLEVRARRGSLLETWSPRDRAYSLPVRVR